MNISYYEIYENLHKEYLPELCTINTSIYENFELWSCVYEKWGAKWSFRSSYSAQTNRLHSQTWRKA
jgi:hypothetical protein